MFNNPGNLEPLHEETVRKILARDEEAAKKAGKASFWKTFNENLEGVIGDKDFRNTVLLHAVKSLQYASRQNPLMEATTTTATSTGGYNKAMLPTIITRVFPQIVATKFIATRQLDVPTQLIQTFRLSRNTNKGITQAGDEFFDPSQYKSRPDTGAKQYKEMARGMDAFYSSQKVTESTATAVSATTAVSKVLAFTQNAAAGDALVPLSIVVYAVSNIDPRARVIVATQTNSTTLTAAGTLTGTGSWTAGTNTALWTPNAGDEAKIVVLLAAAGAVVTTFAEWHFEFAYQYNQERNKNLSEISFKMSTINAVAKSRKNFAQISAEAIQDLEAYSEGKLDALKELVSGMTESMALEIDLEIMLAMMSTAGKTSVYDAKYADNTFRGTTMQKNQELVHRMNYLSNDMSIDFLRGEGMFAITHPHIFTLLQNTNEFKMTSLSDHKAQGNFDIAAEKYGTVNNFTVAKAPQFPFSDRILMGFTSKDLAKAPYAYFPFVTYLTPPSIDVMSGDLFSSVVGLQQRYDHQPLLDGDKGLGVLTVNNLYDTSVYG